MYKCILYTLYIYVNVYIIVNKNTGDSTGTDTYLIELTSSIIPDLVGTVFPNIIFKYTCTEHHKGDKRWREGKKGVHVIDENVLEIMAYSF